MGSHEVGRGYLPPKMPTQGELCWLPINIAVSNDLHQAPVCYYTELKDFYTIFIHRGRGWRFQQDGASPHRSLSTQAFLKRRKLTPLNRGFCPPPHVA